MENHTQWSKSAADTAAKRILATIRQREFDYCKELGDFLIVGLHNDDVVKKYKRTPVMNLDERTQVVESCKYVDKVIKGSDLIVTKEFMEKNNIDLVVHAHNLEECDKYNSFYEYPITSDKFMRLEYTNSISTTDIIKRIKERL